MVARKRKWLLLIAVSLIFTVLFTACDTVTVAETDIAETPVYTVETVVSDADSLLSQEQKLLLSQFAEIYGKILCTLESDAFTGIFYDETGESYYKNIAAYSTLAEIRALSDKKLAVSSAEIIYNIKEVKKQDNGVVVYLTENNRQQFYFMSEPSLSANINHIFKFVEKDGKWFIDDHTREEDFFLLALETWENAQGNTSEEKYRDTVKILIADAQENIASLDSAEKHESEDITSDSNVYNREAAVEYAKQWWNTRNYEDNWLAYDLYGGNCQNFASQCVYAGGIEMDHSGYGEHQWKFYSQALNTRQSPYGRSYSWTGVDPFYSYAKGNKSGMKCFTDIALEYAQKGDIVQVGAYHDWRHSLVVIDVLYSEDGNFDDIIVVSNTADRWNYPLSAYIYTYTRLIHIAGYN